MNGGGGSGTPVSTYILFKNTSPWSVDVYSDSGLTNHVGAVPAGGELRLNWAVGLDDPSFYLIYQALVGNDITVPYGPLSIGPLPVDRGNITSIPIVSPDPSADIINEAGKKVYLLLYNDSDIRGICLRSAGKSFPVPEKVFGADGEITGSPETVNPGERAWYIIENPSSAAYSINADGVTTSFPESSKEFKAGCWYIFRYTNSGLVSEGEWPISLEQLLGRVTVTFDADGGSPDTQTRVVNRSDPRIASITYAPVPGDTRTWTLLDDGRRQSPTIENSRVTKARISFTSKVPNTSISIQLDVSSERRYDWAFISTLDNAQATFEDGYYPESKISGTQSAAVTIPVPEAGSHFIDVGYQKDRGKNGGFDCAWFKVTSVSSVGSVMPLDPERTGYTFDGWYTERNGGGTQFTAATPVIETITVYAKWTGSRPIQISMNPADPVLSRKTLSVDEEAQFSIADEYTSYKWYWDGEIIDGVNSSTYILTANSKPHGIYELSVIAETDKGEQISARCWVTITAN
jgi:uncharacterized repeat protein (TIGR02543 family)